MPLPALILFSHGSLLCGSGRLLEDHASRLRAGGRYCAMEVGYLNYSEPSIEVAVERCANVGATTIIIVPYFLVAGKFMTVDLPRRLADVMAMYPKLEFKIASAIEDEPSMLMATNEVMAGAVPPAIWQARAVAKAKQRCELREDCPLYQSPMCKASG